MMMPEEAPRDYPHGPGFLLELNLPHAARISTRISHYLERWRRSGQLQEDTDPAHAQVGHCANQLLELLSPCLLDDDNPPAPESTQLQILAVEILRELVEQAHSAKLGDDRFGQAVRNLFECLALGREGAVQSLRVGENPQSALRP